MTGGVDVQRDGGAGGLTHRTASQITKGHGERVQRIGRCVEERLQGSVVKGGGSDGYLPRAPLGAAEFLDHLVIVRRNAPVPLGLDFDEVDHLDLIATQFDQTGDLVLAGKEATSGSVYGTSIPNLGQFSMCWELQQCDFCGFGV
jgi:hypothetical protein